MLMIKFVYLLRWQAWHPVHLSQCTSQADGIFRTLLGVGADVAPKAVSKAGRWRKLEPLCKSYLGNALHLLGMVTKQCVTD